MLARYAGAPQPYSALYVYDEILGYRSPVNREVNFAVGKETYTVFFDDEGITDRAGDIDPQLIILGDGVTAGLELPLKDRLAHQLSHLLGGKGVVNLSVTGYGTIQQALLLEEWLAGHQARPKHVILVFNLSNDVLDNVREWDGDRVPNVSLAKGDGEVLPPILPNVIHRKVAALYRESRLAGYLSNRTNYPLDDQLPSQLAGLFEHQLSDEMKKALLGTRAGFEKLEKLSFQYNFELRALFWVDYGLIKGVKNESIAHAVSNIRQLSSGVKWVGSDDLINKNIELGKWENSLLLSGTRHANAQATKAVAHQMRGSLMLRNND